MTRPFARSGPVGRIAKSRTAPLPMQDTFPITHCRPFALSVCLTRTVIPTACSAIPPSDPLLGRMRPHPAKITVQDWARVR